MTDIIGFVKLSVIRHPLAWAVLLLLAMCSPSIALGEIRWGQSLSEAKAQAAKLGRPIVIFWTNGSDPISGTQQIVDEPDVVKLAHRFVWVKLNRKKAPDASAELGIDAYLEFSFPTKEPANQGFVFTDSEGKIYGRIPGKPHTGVLGRMLKGVGRAFGPIPSPAAVSSLQNKLASAKALQKDGQWNGYRRLLREMIETGHRTDSVVKAKSILGRTDKNLLELAEAQARNAWRIRLASARPRGSGAPPKPPAGKDLHCWRNCETCRKALGKAMDYIKTQVRKKTGKATWYDGMLGGFSCGIAMIMEGKSEKELKTWVIPRAATHYLPKSRTAFNGYHNWFQAMCAVVLTEYSLRHGLTDEHRKILEQVHQTAVELVDDTGGWFHHPKRGGKNYARDISSIGCLYYTAFLEMEAMGINAEPGLTLARGYIESLSDGKTIGYGTPFKRGGSGSGGKDGLVLMGLYGSGRADDPLARSLAGWLADPAHHTPQRGHAFGMLHFMGMAVGLHRMGPAYYDSFARKWLHALISVQKPDGSLPKFPHDSKADVAGVVEALKEGDSNWFATGTLASMILMTEPGAFYGLPPKPKRSLPNSEAFEIAEKAFASGQYAKAYSHYAMVLPPGDSMELVPAARAKLRLVIPAARKALAILQARETQISQKFADDRGSEASVAAYEKLISDYTAFITACSGMEVGKPVVKHLPPLKRRLRQLKTVWTRSDRKEKKTEQKPKARSDSKAQRAKRARGKLGLAKSYLESGVKDKAVKILTSIVKDYPETAAAKDARKILAKLE